ncbi:MAG: nucleotidyltransferase domain-containing protein [bacterium]
MREINSELLKEITDKIVSNFNPYKIILFGSYAYGQPKKGSDLDFFIIKDSDLPRHKRSIDIRKLFYGYLIPMDILVYTKQEVDYWKDVKCSFVHRVMKKGKVIYEQKDPACK